MPDPISEKIIHLVAKNNSIEDCMAIIKKAFENDQISLKDYLQNIRQLSTKQSKQIYKLIKINEAMRGMGQPQNAYDLGGMQPMQPVQGFMGYQWM